MKEALLYQKLADKSVHCYLCGHHCKISAGGFGFCGARQNKEGVLYTHTYANIIAAQVDPIEKKPLYHFLPGSNSFSIATPGCNFRCGFCQNWEISQVNLKTGELSEKGLSLQGTLPEDIIAAALKNNCKSISYTYTEPTIFFEYALDCAKLAKEKGLYNIFVTNGYMSAKCLNMVKPYLDAANVDLKFFNDDSYRKVCAASLQPVLDSIKLMHKLGIWVEVTTLVVPDENDSDQELAGIAGFIAGVDKNIPWHISGFHPDYKFTGRQPTSEATLKRARNIGERAGLTYIYVGNVRGWGSDTLCQGCGKVLIKRDNFRILEYNIKDGKCVFCQKKGSGPFFKKAPDPF